MPTLVPRAWAAVVSRSVLVVLGFALLASAAPAATAIASPVRVFAVGHKQRLEDAVS